MDFVLEFTCPGCGTSPRACAHPSHGSKPERCCACYHDEDDHEPLD